MTELTVRSELTEKMDWARVVAPSAMLPKAFQNNPASLLVAAEYADALGINRINALTEIHMVQGRPTLSANLMAAMVRKAGHKLRIMTKPGAVQAALNRADYPDYPFTVVWDMEKAKQSGLLGRDTWKNYPDQMLRNRAISEVVRQGASEILLGATYTPEELGAEVDQVGNPTAPAPAAESALDMLRARVTEPLPDVVEVEAEVLFEDGVDG